MASKILSIVYKPTDRSISSKIRPSQQKLLAYSSSFLIDADVYVKHQSVPLQAHCINTKPSYNRVCVHLLKRLTRKQQINDDELMLKRF